MNVRRFLILSVVSFLLEATAAAQSSGGEITYEEVTYQFTMTMESDADDGIAQGEDYKIEKTTLVGVTVSALVDYEKVDKVSIGYPHGSNPVFAFYFGTHLTDEPLVAGTYADATSLQLDGKHYLYIDTPNTICIDGLGDFSVTSAEFAKVPDESGVLRWVANKFSVSWETKCQTKEGVNRGSLSLIRTDADGGGAPPPDGGDGGGEEPVPPPPTYVRVVAPRAGVFIENAGEAVVAIGTTVHEGYEGPIYLEAFAPPGLTVTFNPQTIPAPGSGSSVMTIKTSEHLLPMRHLIEIRASGPPRGASMVFPVEMECRPPFVAAVDAPMSQSIQQGSTTTLSAIANGSGPLRYQWYAGPRGSTWFPIVGATESSFTTPPLQGSKQYWLRITNSCGSWDSSSIMLRTGERSRGAGR